MIKMRRNIFRNRKTVTGGFIFGKDGTEIVAVGVKPKAVSVKFISDGTCGGGGFKGSSFGTKVSFAPKISESSLAGVLFKNCFACSRDSMWSEEISSGVSGLARSFSSSGFIAVIIH